MRLIKSSFEIIPQQPQEIGMLKHIETCGRVAWKSEERITDDSHISFVNMLKGVNHGSVLEHGTVYLKIKWYSFITLLFFFFNKHSKVKHWNNITTNYRVLIDNKKEKILKYQCEPTDFHEKRYTVRFVCDRGVSHEFVRHRTFSFTQESTRYCNYSKDKFGNEITCIKPCWSDIENMHPDGEQYPEGGNRADDIFIMILHEIEKRYFQLLEQGWKPQQARSVLPNSLKTELIMTGFISDWKHFFMLRTAKGAHPQAQELALPLEQEFKKLNLIK